ncbi:hypothetical protein P280DRAFT_256134 [Massarina eburnea CBS 473.64]|uniref:Uncharacterized protein n=1 Tax=Massarina eburnea CBS 473.64 TaxID=1395130 RepID=A0A6A6SBN6_9PLEO|nr:hypothetical protein P280DRAFT_256134 [Massarina eburnea CBS 473.64]
MPWCTTNDPKAIADYRNRLYDIFNEAVRFAQFLRRQRALWSVRFPMRKKLPNVTETAPLAFDGSYMKDEWGEEDVGQGYYVELVVTPTLWKRGTIDGERFENEEAAVPAKVVLATSPQ